jgi:hypothetical protein
MSDNSIASWNGPLAESAGLVPESVDVFRHARLVLLFSTAQTDGRHIGSLDRLAYFDFFADSPWVVVQGDRRQDETDRRSLVLAGFSDTQLSYASTGQRFVSRRERIRHDLAQLIAYGLVRLEPTKFALTERGAALAENMQSSYAEAYRTSASIVLRRLSGLSGVALQTNVESWLGRSWLLLDLLDDVLDADVPPAPITEDRGTID